MYIYMTFQFHFIVLYFQQRRHAAVQDDIQVEPVKKLRSIETQTDIDWDCQAYGNSSFVSTGTCDNENDPDWCPIIE